MINGWSTRSDDTSFRATYLVALVSHVPFYTTTFIMSVRQMCDVEESLHIPCSISPIENACISFSYFEFSSPHSSPYSTISCRYYDHGPSSSRFEHQVGYLGNSTLTHGLRRFAESYCSTFYDCQSHSWPYKSNAFVRRRFRKLFISTMEVLVSCSEVSVVPHKPSFCQSAKLEDAVSSLYTLPRVILVEHCRATANVCD